MILSSGGPGNGDPLDTSRHHIRRDLVVHSSKRELVDNSAGRTRGDGPVIAQSQIERGGFDGPVRIMDDGRLLLDEPRPNPPKRITTSGAVIHRDSLNTPSYPKYNRTVSNMNSNDSDENIKLIRAAAMGLVSRNSVSSRGLATAVQGVMEDKAIRRSFRDEDGDTPSESDSEKGSQDSSNDSGSTLGVQNISNRSLISVAPEMPRRTLPGEGHSSPSKRSTSRPKALSKLRSNEADGVDSSTIPRRPESSDQAPNVRSSVPAGRPLGASTRHCSTNSTASSNSSLRSSAGDRVGNGASRSSKRPVSGNRSRASFLKDRRLSTINNASRGLMSEDSRRRMLEGLSIGSAGEDGESVSDGSDSDEDDRAVPQDGANAPGGANHVATSKSKGNSDASPMQAMLEIRDSSYTSRGPTIQSLKTHGLSKGEMRGVRRGIASRASMMMFGNDALELSKRNSAEVEADERADSDAKVVHGKALRPEPRRQGSMASICEDESDRDGDYDAPVSILSTGPSKRRLSDASLGMESISTPPPSEIVDEESTMDILSVGQHYLSISMLCYMYSHLRETCRMGHTHATFEEIDVNSYQSLYGLEHLVQGQRYLDNTKSSGGIIRIVIDELESQEEAASRKSNLEEETMGANRKYEKEMMAEFRKWIEESKTNQLDKDTEEMIMKLKSHAARRRWKKAKNIISVGRILNKKRSSSAESSSSSFTSLVKGKTQEGRDIGRAGTPDSIVDASLTADQHLIVQRLRKQVARYRWKRAITRVRLAIRMAKPGFKPDWGEVLIANEDEERNSFVDMKKLLGQALEEQPKYFREGSLMNNLIESGIEIVWFSDLSQSDVVYGVCCQRAQKRITVVFRGSANSHNWSINMKYDTNGIPNPILEYYTGRQEILDVHTGYSLYMLRRRKDTQMNKIEEIFEKLDEIGREICPEGNYKLSITGHSLGGALATILGFYVASNERFRQVKTVRVYTYAAPRVGGRSFLNAYQHLERMGKIRHARFSATQDIVPLIPFTNFDGFNPLRWKYYKHVGMRVELHGTGRVGKWRIQRALDVTFPLDFNFFSEARRAFMNNILFNLTTYNGFKANHRLTEYYKRLHFANQYRLALAKSLFIHDKRRNRLKTLDQYYHLRAHMVLDDGIDGSFDVTWQIAGHDPSAATFKKAVAIALIIPLIFCWGFLVASICHSISGEMAHLPPSAGLDLLPDIVVDTPRPASLNGGPSVEIDDEVIDLDALSDSLVLEDVLPRLESIREYSTGITFVPHLNGLYLVGAGVRKKSIVKVYAVAMYSSPTVLLSATSSSSLGIAARTFSDSNNATTFQLEMVYSVSAEKIASAIAESVRPRYQGSPSNISELESLIIKGVNEFGGQAYKGTTFQFECTSQGVLVTVNDSLQGGATFEGLGSALVDVFMDESAVSPTLVDSCLKTWSSEEAQSLAASLLSFEVPSESDASSEGVQDDAFDAQAGQSLDLESLENQLKPVQEYATSITFESKLDNLYLVGAGVRKKSIIKIYAVAMYASAQVLVSSSSQGALHAAARSFDGPNSATAFVLEMVYSVGAEKIAGAIAESVKPRYSGPESDIINLEQMITEGVNRVGGQAVKGTVFRFDCTSLGVAVSVNGLSQGSASFEGLGAAFVDVFMDNDAVSPTLVESCLSMWSGASSNTLAMDLLQASSRLATKPGVPSAVSGEEDRSASSEEDLESAKSDLGSQSSEEDLTVMESIESELEPNGPGNVEPLLLQTNFSGIDDAVADNGETIEMSSFAPDLFSQIYQSQSRAALGADSAHFDDGPGHDYTGMNIRQIATRRAENFCHRKQIMISNEVVAIRRQLVIQSDALDRIKRNLAIWIGNGEEEKETVGPIKILFPVF
ncbi:hypothetical protein THAOC_28172 [Thalassiosira oceanica]|uniref:Fungal lipase-like domain-containing protein n=1 Tax=Thalassiosira oceanica TaxID=159749 RepID=K0RFL7_THAOC|nr:hypothetical protein THAOC_28172 [Thalassiosira oceanica]|eukprot:EJK52538.1 hypothetical protein THAOC_28172 [Thalassiosira oceanica]